MLAPFFGIALLCIGLLSGTRAKALEIVVLKHEGKEITVSGRLVEEAADGGVVIQSSDGVIWAVEPDNLVKRSQDSREFQPLTREELADKLKQEFPPGCEVYTTKNYLICHYTSQAYAKWCGSLLERLRGSFSNYWTQRGFELKELEFPLVVVILPDRDSFVNFSRGELKEAAESVIGYYSFRTNRVTMCDLTGIDALRIPGARLNTADQIARVLSRPEAEMNVATIVHEATHQIAYSNGLHARYSDVPLFMSEGMAVFFETPDVKSAKGWKTIGNVNRVRLHRFREYLSRRPAGSLESLITTDKRFKETDQALDAYAEAWALTYYLLKHKPKEYRHYLQSLASKRPFHWDKPEKRLEEFKAAFGNDLEKLDADFVKYIATQVR